MKITTMVRQQVVVYTIHHRVEGEVQLPEYGRLSDRLNQGRDFVPITNATVCAPTGEPLFALDAVMVNRAHIVMVHEQAPVPAGGR